MQALRNLPTEAPAQLSDLIGVQSGRVVSMAMSSVDGCQMTLLAFDEDESVSEEMYFGDTLYYIVEGGLTVSIDGASHDMHVGDCLAVPAKTPHAVAAIGSCKILQITLTE